jgi:protein-tyrosine phosphatase
VNFSVLCVCTGNICRSPAMELLLRARVRGLPIEVSSAGTGGLSGHEMDAPSAYAVREYGIDTSTHVARRLAPDMIRTADLILTADSTHRSVIVQQEPLVFRRTFTIREFARLGAGLGPLGAEPTPERLRARLTDVAAQRGIVDPGADDIADPLGGGVDVGRATVATIASAVDGAVLALGLQDVPAAS